MKLHVNGLYTYIFLSFFITSNLLHASNDVDRLTAYLHPALANKMRQELMPKPKKSTIAYPPQPILRRSTNAPEFNSQEKINSLLIDMKILNLNQTKTSIDAVIKNNDIVDAAQGRMDAKYYLSKTLIAGTISIIAQIINVSVQQKQRTNQSPDSPFRIFGIDDAAIASLLAQAAQPLLYGGLIIGSVCYIEHKIRAGDLKEIEHLKKDHEKEIEKLTHRINTVSGLLKETKASIAGANINITELKESYESMIALVNTQMMPKIAQLLKQTTKNKKNITNDLATQQLREQLNDLTIEIGSQSSSENDSIAGSSINGSSQDRKLLRQPSIQGVVHKAWKTFSAFHADQEHK